MHPDLSKNISHYLLYEIFLLAFLIPLLVGDVCAGRKEDLRAWAGLELFPSLLSADMNITDKSGPDGKLLLVLIYRDQDRLAIDMATYLKELDEIRKIPIKVELTKADSFLESYKDKKIAGIFLTQRLQKKELENIISFGRKRHFIIFSPLEGDVERGVHGGISVIDRVLPYLNREALQLSNIVIKPFFLKISEIYE